ncbi:hypothetical protein [Sphingomonas sp.]|uniref:hypothetical protein n=1 Tax=Sphingomonas sp. TaxID=28214 RepID=UPI003F702358
MRNSGVVVLGKRLERLDDLFAIERKEKISRRIVLQEDWELRIRGWSLDRMRTGKDVVGKSSALAAAVDVPEGSAFFPWGWVSEYALSLEFGIVLVKRRSSRAPFQ